MNIDPVKLERAQRLGARMREAVRKMDVPAIVKTGTDPEIEIVDFIIGKNYRLATIGSVPVQVEKSIPEASDTVPVAIGKLTGMDAAATMDGAGLLEFRATYAGRLPQSPMFPHVFRMMNGRHAVVADMDIVAWEILK